MRARNSSETLETEVRHALSTKIPCRVPPRRVELAKHSGRSSGSSRKNSTSARQRWVVHEFTKGSPEDMPTAEVEQLRRECARLVQEREILKKALALYARRHSFGESVRNSSGIQAPWHDSRRCVQAAPRLQERLLCVAQSEAREAGKREQGSLDVHPWDPPVLRGALQGSLSIPKLFTT